MLKMLMLTYHTKPKTEMKNVSLSLFFITVRLNSTIEITQYFDSRRVEIRTAWMAMSVILLFLSLL